MINQQNIDAQGCRTLLKMLGFTEHHMKDETMMANTNVAELNKACNEKIRQLTQPILDKELYSIEGIEPPIEDTKQPSG